MAHAPATEYVAPAPAVIDAAPAQQLPAAEPVVTASAVFLVIYAAPAPVVKIHCSGARRNLRRAGVALRALAGTLKSTDAFAVSAGFIAVADTFHVSAVELWTRTRRLRITTASSLKDMVERAVERRRRKYNIQVDVQEQPRGKEPSLAVQKRLHNLVSPWRMLDSFARTPLRRRMPALQLVLIVKQFLEELCSDAWTRCPLSWSSRISFGDHPLKNGNDTEKICLAPAHGRNAQIGKCCSVFVSWAILWNNLFSVVPGTMLCSPCCHLRSYTLLQCPP